MLIPLLHSGRYYYVHTDMVTINEKFGITQPFSTMVIDISSTSKGHKVGSGCRMRKRCSARVAPTE